MRLYSENVGEAATDIADLFADSKCAICGDTGHFIIDDTGPEYVTSPCPECNAPDAWRMFDGEGGYDYTHDEETAERWKKHCGEKYASWVEQLYLAPPTSAQHSRIVAAKDAEIARLKAEPYEYLPDGIAEAAEKGPFVDPVALARVATPIPVELIRNAIDIIVRASVQIDSEWGMGMNEGQLRANGDEWIALADELRALLSQQQEGGV